MLVTTAQICESERMRLVILASTVWLAVVPARGNERLDMEELFARRDSFIESREREEPIETDRHDFTQSARTVGRGVAQLEFGYSYFYNDDGEEIESTHAFPELMLRVGLNDWLEFGTRWNYASRFIDESGNLDGAEDLRLNFKASVCEQCGCRPETAVELRSSVPTGGSDWSTDNVTIGGALIYEWEISEQIGFGGSTSYFTDGAGDISLFEAEDGQTDSFNTWAQSAALRMHFHERSTTYLEWFGLWSDNLGNEFVQHYINIGVDVLITNDFVIDFRIGKGLSSDAEDLFVGVGGGIRF